MILSSAQKADKPARSILIEGSVVPDTPASSAVPDTDAQCNYLRSSKVICGLCTTMIQSESELQTLTDSRSVMEPAGYEHLHKFWDRSGFSPSVQFSDCVRDRSKQCSQRCRQDTQKLSFMYLLTIWKGHDVSMEHDMNKSSHTDMRVQQQVQDVRNSSQGLTQKRSQ